MTATGNPARPRRRAVDLRARAAREVSRLAMIDAAADYNRAMLRALRAEIRTVVREASPLLFVLLEREAIALDDVVSAMLPGDDWPFDSRHWAKVRHATSTYLPKALRHQAARLASPGSSIPPVATAAIPVRDMDDVVVEVVERSLEVRARVGSATIGTHDGTLDLFVDHAVPATLLAACAGRPIDGIVDLEPLKGQGWLIADARDHSLYTDCTVFKIWTGTSRCRLSRNSN